MIALLLFCCMPLLAVYADSGDEFPVHVLEKQSCPKLLQSDMKAHGKTLKQFMDSVQLWDNGKIPYQICQNFSMEVQEKIRKGMSKITSRVPCVRFVERTNEPTWIKFRPKGEHCAFEVGKPDTPGKHCSDLPPQCQTEAIIMHALLHAAGLVHEHTRPDRLGFIEKFNMDNVASGKKSEFEIAYPKHLFPNKYEGIYGGIYSVMMYSPYAYSSNDQMTIVPKYKEQVIPVMKTITTIYASDEAQLKYLYKC